MRWSSHGMKEFVVYYIHILSRAEAMSRNQVFHEPDKEQVQKPVSQAAPWLTSFAY